MDASVREALTHIDEAMRQFMAVMATDRRTEAQAVYDPQTFDSLTRQLEKAKQEAIPRILAQLTAAASLLDRTHGDLRKGIDAFDGMIRTQERMWVLAKAADLDNPKWSAEYRDCVKRNRRYGADIDKYFLRASRKHGFGYDDTGIHVGP